MGKVEERSNPEGPSFCSRVGLFRFCNRSWLGVFLASAKAVPVLILPMRGRALISCNPLHGFVNLHGIVKRKDLKLFF